MAKLDILVFAAHPDDAELGCGGMIISMLEQGYKVGIVDLTEGESELVSGYNVEYSAMTFALFFLAEYSHIILMSLITVLLFFGG